MEDSTLMKRTMAVLILMLLLFGLSANVSARENAAERGTADLPRIRPYQILFNSGGSIAITMYDACSQTPIVVPEYNYDTTLNNPAAYVRGSGPLTIRVKWRVESGETSEATVWATGTFGGFAPTVVTFSGDESDWISMTTQQALPDVINTSNVSWEWKFKIGSSEEMVIGQTDHVIYTVHRKPSSSPVYLDLVKWTTDWCKGLPAPYDDKAIADEVLNGFASSGVIRYGIPGWTTPDILCKKGGMCGGMMEVFYDACGTQGVHVARSCYILKNAAPKPEYKWRSMIIFSPGIGNQEPTRPEQGIREVDNKYPCPKYLGDSATDDDIEYQVEKAYEFFAPDDGHCINFLTYEGKIYLYDLSFGTGPWPDTFSRLPDGMMKGKKLKPFRMNYMDEAIDYMRGEIEYKTDKSRCSFHKKGPLLDVKSTIIPYSNDEFAYKWYTIP